ncbi:MAG: UbiA family prenyltransferase, partial [Phycisphaerales bacterium]|nr:UbiA family prenyltransferase [Phycisphaerales bacterium]
MTAITTPTSPPSPAPPLWLSLVRLARPTQWAKSVFVLVGPFYGLRDMLPHKPDVWAIALATLWTAAAFCLVSSACYVVNDLMDAEADRLHPRKKHRPIAAGLISPGLALGYAAALFAGSAAVVLSLDAAHRAWVGVAVGLYAANVLAYSLLLKHRIIIDVISLSLGFVLRVMAGCAAAGVEPSVWLLNVTFFLSMFLAFGKRLGERRVLARAVGASAGEAGAGSGGGGGGGGGGRGGGVGHRKVQGRYTEPLLQMAVVVGAVVTLMAYALLVQNQGAGGRLAMGFNLLGLTLLPG